jgi:PAS domain S-box-containing protein
MTTPSASSPAAAELADLRVRLQEASDTIAAIRGGGVDSLIVGSPGQEQVYALSSADRAYRLIVAAMNEGAATVSPDGTILDANPRLAAMTGRLATELVGTAAVNLATEGQREAFARMLDEGVRAGSRGEIELSGPGGAVLPVQLAVSGFDFDGMPLSCLIMTDLGAQRAAEERAAQRTAEVEQANRNLEAFSYSVSHDLRAPLRALHGFSEALLEEYGDRLDETGRGYATRVQAASERMAALIDDLLHLSRVTRAGISLAPVNLSAEVEELAGDLRRRSPDRAVRVVIQDEVWVNADRALIRSVAQNLIENAWKFTSRRADAVIEFGTVAAASDAEICCYVRDNGAGFDDDYADKLFQPFQRLHSADDFPGTGIGLASVQRIIERHGGHAWAEGVVDRGATFYFTLPRNHRPDA